MNVSDADTIDFGSLFKQLHPESILFIGREGSELFDEYTSAVSNCRFDIVDKIDNIDALNLNLRYDLVFVMRAIEYMPKDQAIALISRLRDVIGRRLIMVVPIGMANSEQQSIWQVQDLLALGMVAIGEGQVAQHRIQVFGFDIMTYKTTPDWLNSRYWAHPELFGRFWW